MSFIKIGGDDKKIRFPSAPDKLPIFLIPGILGNGNEFDTIAWELFQQSDYQRPIYIYYDDRVTSPDNANFDITLEELVKSIAEEIQQTIPDPVGSFPFFIIGYSYGCMLATLTAQHLKEQGEDPYVYLIDGTAPQCAKQYFIDEKTHFMNDVIHIMNYAAQLSHLKGCSTENENILKELLDKESLEEYIEHIAKVILLETVQQLHSSPLRAFKQLDIEDLRQLSCKATIECIEKAIPLDSLYTCSQSLQDFEISLKNFQQFMMIVKTNLCHIINYTPINHGLLPSLTALITANTASKYNSKGGWEVHATNVNLVGYKKLLKQNHMDLLKEPTKDKLTYSINQFLKRSISREQFKEKVNRYVASDLKRYDNSGGDDDMSMESEDEEVVKPASIRSSKSRSIYLIPSSNDSISDDNMTSDSCSTSPMMNSESEENYLPSSTGKLKTVGLFSNNAKFSPSTNNVSENEENNREAFTSSINNILDNTAHGCCVRRS